MTKQTNLAILALLTLYAGLAQADDAIKLGDWQMHRGEGPVALKTNGGGDPAAYTKMRIPVSGALGWEPAPMGKDGEVFFDEKSVIPCNQQVDFTYFQNTVSVPDNVDITTFSVSYDLADDGARIYLFNSKYPTGTYDEKADLTRNSKPGSVNLASLVAKGNNRIVVAQYDNCKVLNRVHGIKISVNGIQVKAGSIAAGSGAPAPTPVQAAAKNEDPYAGKWYRLKTMFRGNGECLEGNEFYGSAHGGAAFMTPCANVSGQLWKLERQRDGNYRLKTMFRGENECFEGNKMGSPMKGGASFMDRCQPVMGQLWQAVPANDGYVRLKTTFGGKGACLEGNQGSSSVAGGGAFMDKCQNVSGQLWKLEEAK